MCDEREWSEVNVCADALRVASVRRARRANQRRQGHVVIESVCAEETRAAGTRVNQRPAVCSGTKGKSRLPFSFLFVWELCVSGVEASSVRIESCKLSVCRVRRL